MNRNNDHTDSVEPLEPEQWVDRYGNELFKMAYFKLRDSSTAEDIVQETFVAAVKSAKSFRGDSSLRTWLFSILKNKIIDFFRQKYKNTLIGDLSKNDEDVDSQFDRVGMWNSAHAPSRWSRNPEDDFENKELRMVLNHCLEALPENYRAAFTLSTVEGEDSKEVCKVMKITSSNLWVLLYRARMRLRKCLEAKWFNSEQK